MVRHIENLMYALAGGKADRPGFKDDETGVTFASTPISPNLMPAQLASRPGPTAPQIAEAGLAGHSTEDIAAALKAVLGDEATEVGRLLSTS